MYECPVLKNMLIENVDYFVHLVPFPPGPADGMVTKNDDGTYTIYLNSNVGEEQRRKALEHEMNHITMGHLDDNDLPLDVAEREADTGVIDVPEVDAETQMRLALMWADCMMKIHGWSDSVPEYDPVVWRTFVFRHGLMSL